MTSHDHISYPYLYPLRFTPFFLFWLQLDHSIFTRLSIFYVPSFRFYLDIYVLPSSPYIPCFISLCILANPWDLCRYYRLLIRIITQLDFMNINTSFRVHHLNLAYSTASLNSSNPQLNLSAQHLYQAHLYSCI